VSETSHNLDAAEPVSAASRATALWTDIFQGLLIACVVIWVLDVPRRLFGVAFYTEQLLAICLGFGLALSFVGGKPKQTASWDWGGVIASAAIGAYIVHRYYAGSDVPLPLLASLGASLLWAAVGSRAALTRWLDWIGAFLSLAICLYIAFRYHQLTYEIALLPTEGIVGSALLVLLVLEATGAPRAGCWS
jgi:TRAP-type uncharacterized transport system fused permease subunit